MESYSRNVTDVDKLVQLLSRVLEARSKFGLQVELWLLDQPSNWSQLISNSANQPVFHSFIHSFLTQWHKQQQMCCFQTPDSTLVLSGSRDISVISQTPMWVLGVSALHEGSVLLKPAWTHDKRVRLRQLSIITYWWPWSPRETPRIYFTAKCSLFSAPWQLCADYTHS